MKKDRLYYAVVRKGTRGNIRLILARYRSKQEFAYELRGNGFRVLQIFSQKNVDEVLRKKYGLTAAEEYIQYILGR